MFLLSLGFKRWAWGVLLCTENSKSDWAEQTCSPENGHTVVWKAMIYQTTKTALQL